MYLDVVLSRFNCEHCDHSNTDVTFDQAVEDMGVKIDVNVYTSDCLNRYVVLSEFATISIPKINKDIHKDTKKGHIMTVRECFRIAADELKLKQEQLKGDGAEADQDHEEAINILEQMYEGKEMAYHFLVIDPSGNSHVQNPHAPSKDVYVSNIKWDSLSIRWKLSNLLH